MNQNAEWTNPKPDLDNQLTPRPHHTPHLRHIPNIVIIIMSFSSIKREGKRKVLLCGGGNAIHVLTSYIGSRTDCDVAIFSTFPGEADRIRDAIPDMGIQCVNDLGEIRYGRPIQVSDNAKDVVPGSDVIILAIPSFAHKLYLKAVAPLVEPGVIIGAMPGEGGFDLSARHVLGSDFVDQSNLFALETLPWACRIVVRVVSATISGYIQFVSLIY